MDGINSDKVNINLGESSGGGGSMAAVIAALGNRNQGNDNAALIAALGNRNEKDYGPLMAMMANRHDEGGMNSMWPILLLLLAGRRGGFGGGGDDCDNGVSPAQAAILQTLMEGQSDLRAQVPTTALETQNAIQLNLAQLALGTQQGFSNVKDSVQLGIAGVVKGLCDVNQNVSSQGCQTREAVASDGDRTRGLLTARFQLEDSTKINELNARVIALETHGHNRSQHDELKFQVTNNNTAIATQQQQQQQRQSDENFHRLFAALGGIANQVQVARNVNDTINFGTMAASGIQSTPTTQVR